MKSVPLSWITVKYCLSVIVCAVCLQILPRRRREWTWLARTVLVLQQCLLLLNNSPNVQSNVGNEKVKCSLYIEKYSGVCRDKGHIYLRLLTQHIVLTILLLLSLAVPNSDIKQYHMHLKWYAVSGSHWRQVKNVSPTCRRRLSYLSLNSLSEVISLCLLHSWKVICILNLYYFFPACLPFLRQFDGGLKKKSQVTRTVLQLIFLPLPPWAGVTIL